MKIDLHSHSYYSDGFLSPKALITLAKEQACDMLCLSDHDTTSGLDQAQLSAKQLDIKLIHGVEISALWQNQTIHIVGLNIDKNNSTLQQGLQTHQRFRQDRALLMAQGLEQAGVKNAYEKAMQLAPQKMLTRTHFAQMLVKEKVCSSMGNVFKRFLTGNKPGAVKPQWQSLEQVVSWIRQAGGLAVLAHPFRYQFSLAKIGRMLNDFSGNGGDGIEVVVASSTLEEVQKAEQLALEYQLLASQGSDYHGWQGQYHQLGKLLPMPKTLTPVWQQF